MLNHLILSVLLLFSLISLASISQYHNLKTYLFSQTLLCPYQLLNWLNWPICNSSMFTCKYRYMYCFSIFCMDDEIAVLLGYFEKNKDTQ